MHNFYRFFSFLIAVIFSVQSIYVDYAPLKPISSVGVCNELSSFPLSKQSERAWTQLLRPHPAVRKIGLSLFYDVFLAGFRERHLIGLPCFVPLHSSQARTSASFIQKKTMRVEAITRRALISMRLSPNYALWIARNVANPLVHNGLNLIMRLLFQPAASLRGGPKRVQAHELDSSNITLAKLRQAPAYVVIERPLRTASDVHEGRTDLDLSFPLSNKAIDDWMADPKNIQMLMTKLDIRASVGEVEIYYAMVKQGMFETITRITLFAKSQRYDCALHLARDRGLANTTVGKEVAHQNRLREIHTGHISKVLMSGTLGVEGQPVNFYVNGWMKGFEELHLHMVDNGGRYRDPKLAIWFFDSYRQGLNKETVKPNEQNYLLASIYALLMIYPLHLGRFSLNAGDIVVKRTDGKEKPFELALVTARELVADLEITVRAKKITFLRDLMVKRLYDLLRYELSDSFEGSVQDRWKSDDGYVPVDHDPVVPTVTKIQGAFNGFRDLVRHKGFYDEPSISFEFGSLLIGVWRMMKKDGSKSAHPLERSIFEWIVQHPFNLNLSEDAQHITAAQLARGKIAEWKIGRSFPAAYCLLLQQTIESAFSAALSLFPDNDRFNWNMPLVNRPRLRSLTHLIINSILQEEDVLLGKLSPFPAPLSAASA